MQDPSGQAEKRGGPGTWWNNASDGSDLGSNSVYKFGIAEIALAPNNTPTGKPSLAGDFEVGRRISIDTSAIQDADNHEYWTPTLKYSWEISNNPGDFSTVMPIWQSLDSVDANNGDEILEITDDLKGKLIRGVVSYLDGYGTNETVFSDASLIKPNETSDVTAPKLVSYKLSSYNFDLSNGDITIDVTATIADDISGVFDGIYANGNGGSASQARWRSPSGKQFLDAGYFSSPSTGNFLNGTYKDQTVLGTHSESGTWTLDSFLLADEAGNSKYLNKEELTELGIQTTFEVSNGIKDTEAPIVFLNENTGNFDIIYKDLSGSVGVFTANEPVNWLIDSSYEDSKYLSVNSSGIIKFLNPADALLKTNFLAGIVAIDQSGNSSKQAVRIRTEKIEVISGIDIEKKLDIKKIDFKSGPVEVIKSLDWSKIDIKKAIKNTTFKLDTVNWTTINNNDKAATKAYKAIDWETQDFTSLPKELAWDKIDLKKASASDTFALDVVDWTTINNNDKAATKAYKAIDWETQDFTSIPKELAWDKIDLKKASASDTFALDVVDWTTINNNDKPLPPIKSLQSNQR